MGCNDTCIQVSIVDSQLRVFEIYILKYKKRLDSIQTFNIDLKCGKFINLHHLIIFGWLRPEQGSGGSPGPALHVKTGNFALELLITFPPKPPTVA